MIEILEPHEAKERPSIERGSRILGGIMLTQVQIAVDYDENPGPYEIVYSAVDRAISEEMLESSLEICRTVDLITRGVMPFSSVIRNLIYKSERDILGVDRLDGRNAVNLSLFIEQNGGMCHQQSLLEASLLELLQERRGIGGQVSIVDFDSPLAYPDKHSTVRYERGEDKVAIDSSENLVIKLHDGSDPGSSPIDVQKSRRLLLPHERL